MKAPVKITLWFRFDDGTTEEKEFEVAPEVAKFINDREESYVDLEEDYYKLEEMCAMQRLVIEGTRPSN